MKDPGVEEHMTHTKRIGLFALTVIIGLAHLGSIQWVKQGVDQEFFCSGVNYTIVNFGFFVGSVISTLLTGFIASLVFRDTFQSRKDLIVVSACSSCAAGFVWLFTLYFLSVYTEFQNGHDISGSMFRDLVIVSITHIFWSGLFAFLFLPLFVFLPKLIQRAMRGDTDAVIELFGKNEQVKKVFWTLFIAMAGLVMAQVLDPVTAQQIIGIITGMGT